MSEHRIDLERLGLSSGEARDLELALEPAAPMIGGERFPLVEQPARARLDVSKTTTGFALRLRMAAAVGGPCARCLEPAERPVEIDVREVDQPGAGDAELRSPYVDAAGVLDLGDWVRDALVLTLPEKIVCREDCAGLCEVCGVSLNEVDPAEHDHERPLDPRFAKLRELTGE